MSSRTLDQANPHPDGSTTAGRAGLGCLQARPQPRRERRHHPARLQALGRHERSACDRPLTVAASWRPAGVGGCLDLNRVVVTVNLWVLMRSCLRAACTPSSPTGTSNLVLGASGGAGHVAGPARHRPPREVGVKQGCVQSCRRGGRGLAGARRGCRAGCVSACLLGEFFSSMFGGRLVGGLGCGPLGARVFWLDFACFSCYTAASTPRCPSTGRFPRGPPFDRCPAPPRPHWLRHYAVPPADLQR